MASLWAKKQIYRRSNTPPKLIASPCDCGVLVFENSKILPHQLDHVLEQEGKYPVVSWENCSTCGGAGIPTRYFEGIELDIKKREEAGLVECAIYPRYDPKIKKMKKMKKTKTKPKTTTEELFDLLREEIPMEVWSTTNDNKEYSRGKKIWSRIEELASQSQDLRDMADTYRKNHPYDPKKYYKTKNKKW